VGIDNSEEWGRRGKFFLHLTPVSPSFFYIFTLTLPSPFRENLQGEPIKGEG
jgi:hypothetical protein